jgi:DNA-binding MarR family transcriptional regulator
MTDTTKTMSATRAMTDRAMTGLFSRAFAQPLKLLGQPEASLSSYAVFWSVAFNEGSTQVEVARLTGLSAKTVSRVISQLGDTTGGRGWIRQAYDENDRRVRRLFLTRSGKQVHRRLVKDIQEFTTRLQTAG